MCLSLEFCGRAAGEVVRLRLMMRQTAVASNALSEVVRAKIYGRVMSERRRVGVRRMSQK
jgi:hypothetical protein